MLGDILIRFGQQRQVIRVTFGDVPGQIILERDVPIHKAVCHADQVHPPGRQLAKVDRMPTIGAADGDGDMFAALWRGLFLPFAQNAQPITEIPPPIPARRTIMGAD